MIRVFCRDPRRPPDWGDYLFWIALLFLIGMGIAYVLRALMLHIAERYGRG